MESRFIWTGRPDELMAVQTVKFVDPVLMHPSTQVRRPPFWYHLSLCRGRCTHQLCTRAAHNACKHSAAHLYLAHDGRTVHFYYSYSYSAVAVTVTITVKVTVALTLTLSVTIPLPLPSLLLLLVFKSSVFGPASTLLQVGTPWDEARFQWADLVNVWGSRLSVWGVVGNPMKYWHKGVTGPSFP